MSQGNLYIVSAPSGAGKSSLIAALLERDSGSPKMVSIPTRPASLALASKMVCIIILYQKMNLRY